MHHGQGRSSTGAGFYLEEEEDDYSAGRAGRGQGGYGSSHGPPTRTRSMSESFEQNDYKEETEVVELLTKAAVTQNDQVKLENLTRVKEIIVNRQPALLDNFLDEMLNFLLDNSPQVRRYILEFIEEACKTDSEVIPKILHNMQIMLSDPIVSVQKKAIQVTGKIYKLTLMWLCRSKTVTDEMENSWSTVNDMKRSIIKQIDSDNDGIRTHTVKFIETVILLQTSTEPDSVQRENEFSLDNVPITLKVARHRRLEEDARLLFDELLKFHGSRHATSVNLMTCMGSLVIISKLRPSLMGRVVSAIEKLNAILPPTLERSQVQSVRKHMKLQLIGLLKHSRAVDYYDNITTLLTDLGASYHDLSKAIPNWDEIRLEKRKRQREEKEEISRKRARVVVEEEVEEENEEEVAPVLEEDYDDEDEDEDEEPDKHRVMPKKTVEVESQSDEVEKLVFEKLTPSMVADLVIAFMDRLPDSIPAHFTSAYTPVAIAGQDTQIRHVARLLSAQINVYQQATSGSRPLGYAEYGAENPDAESVVLEAPIPTLVSNAPMMIAPPPNDVFPQPLGSSKVIMGGSGKKKVLKAVKLGEVTKPLSEFDKQKQGLSALKRILESSENLSDIKSDLVSSIVITSASQIRVFVMQHIKNDIRNRLDLGLRWLFGEYSLCQGFLSKALPVLEDSSLERYEWTFVSLMTAVLENAPDFDKANLCWRLYMEPPMIPDRGVELLKYLCGQVSQSGKGMQLLFELTTKRPKKLHYLSALLEFCAHSSEEVRTNGVKAVLQLYEAGEGVKIIEDKAINTYLFSLSLPKPPEILFADGLGRPVVQADWTEDLVKASAQLYFQLVCVKNSLIHELAKVYVDTTADVKRTILRQVEPPVRKMGIESPDLMKLLDTFPKGAETLVTRIIHILTDKTLPTVDLVSRVKNLFHKRVSDVRFLIPILNGLTQTDIITALPKLIKLNPNIVKEVFNRLLGTHSDAESQHKSPLTPVELMVELHCMEASKCDVKTIIKATSLCFNETEVYTAETLASVISQLVEKDPFPTLLMRTVIQSLALHPKLSGFVMGTLSRLVIKQVWTQPKVWEGFIKCCQRTIPKSAPILLKLPAAQLQQVLNGAPDLRDPLVRQLMSMTREQRGCLPLAVREIVFGKDDAYLVKRELFYDDYGDEISTLGEVHSNHTMSLSSDSGLLKLEPRSPTGIKDEPMEYQTNDD